MQKPIYDKVKAGAAGAGIGGAATVFVMWVLDAYFLAGANMPDYVHGALELIVSAIIIALGAAAGSFFAGYKQAEVAGK